MVPSLLLLSCELSVSVKENLIEKKRVLQPTASKAIKNQFQTKFLEGVLKISESFQEELLHGIPV